MSDLLWRRFDQLRGEHDEMRAAIQRKGPWRLSVWREWRDLERHAAKIDAVMIEACRYNGAGD